VEDERVGIQMWMDEKDSGIFGNEREDKFTGKE
jgi:hypothetical protein